MEPAGRGLYALASLNTTLLLLPLGPVWVGNVVEMTRRHVTLPELLGGSVVIAAVGGLATGLVALAVAPLLGDQWWVLAFPAVVTPFMLLQHYEEGFYTGLGHVRAVSLIKVAAAVTPLVFIAAAAARGGVAAHRDRDLDAVVRRPCGAHLHPPALPRGQPAASS